MTLECPKCKSPVAREGQRFCYRCGHELIAYYDSLNITVKESDSLANPAQSSAAEASRSGANPEPQRTMTLASEGTEITTETVVSPEPKRKAMLRILLPTGDVFDREIVQSETQMGKGAR